MIKSQYKLAGQAKRATPWYLIKVRSLKKFLTHKFHKAIKMRMNFNFIALLIMTKIITAFRNFLSEKNLHYTNQRSLIVEEFIQSKKHLSAEELYEIVKEKGETIGQATVFRTLKLLEEARIATPVNFGDKTVRYELAFGAGHHDHLVCTKCGKILEIYDSKLENRKEKICKKNGFLPSHHRLEIFGICKACR